MVAERVVTVASRLLSRRLDRRGLLARAAVVGSAVATSGLDYVLRPGTAYASVCGSGASCGSGWTAMCCTINHGVNQCPPGSFAGGWWKADGASLCGGHARYYIDCQAECTKCGCGGGAFCGHGCWDCRSHCADGPCDKRHVCRNVFRYGQCRRDKHCSGPVMCRAITCTPPWKWADCSAASATDNATRSHSATCLSGWSPIAERYTALGSQGSLLGASVDHELTEHHHGHRVQVQRYVHGRMYWSHATGAHYLTGEFAHRYLHLGELDSSLGLPTGDLRHVSGGRSARFQHGGMYARPGHPAYALWGNVFHAWQSHGGRSGALGFPTTSLVDVSGGGHFARFQHGGVYDGPDTRLCVLGDVVDAVYAELDGPVGVLGWPKHEAVTLPDGVGERTRFAHGEVYQHPAYGTRALYGAIDEGYRRLHAQSGPLGYPRTPVVGVTSGRRSAGSEVLTVNGAVALRADATTAYGVWDHVFAAWQQYGGAGGSLGFPLADMTVDQSGNERGAFEHGTVQYDAATGRTTVVVA